jgi:hypothetical protein
VVLAEELPTAGEGVLAASLLVLTQLVQVIGEVMGREQGMWVVVAEDLPAAGEGVLVEAASLLVLTQLVQGIGEVMRRGQGAPGYRMVFDELGRWVTQPMRRSTNHPSIDVCPDQGQNAINQARWQSGRSVTKCRQGVNLSTPCVHLEGEMSCHGCQGTRAWSR